MQAGRPRPIGRIGRIGRIGLFNAAAGGVLRAKSPDPGAEPLRGQLAGPRRRASARLKSWCACRDWGRKRKSRHARGRKPCRNHLRKHRTRCCHPIRWGFVAGACRCSSIPELKRLLEQLGTNIVQIACGDPHHASWDEGDALPAAARASGIVMTGAMLGFPGEDYTTPATIKETGGFGNPALRAERIERLKWALDRTLALGLFDLSLHAGFLPTPGEKARSGMLAALAEAAKLAAAKGVTLAFETGQETAELLRATLDELAAPALKVNFDPANMLLYDMGDPMKAVEILAPDIRSVHVKDARRPSAAASGARKCPWVPERSISANSCARSSTTVTRARSRSSAKSATRRAACAMSRTV